MDFAVPSDHWVKLKENETRDKYFCCILTFDPARHTIPKTRKCIFHWRGRAWLTIWDRVRIPRYSHRLMHRKRVTCELHDSYFRLMTIKYAIPKTAKVTHSDGQLWEDIEWAIELSYNSVKTRSHSVWRPDKLVIRCGRESQHPAEGALGTPDWVWGSEEMEKWCCRENSTQQRAGLSGLRLNNPGEWERQNADGNKSGEVNMW